MHSAARSSVRISAWIAALGLLLGLAGLGCGSQVAPPADERASEGADVAEGAEPGAPEADAHAPLVVFLGDSLTAGFGLTNARTESYPALIERTLRDEGQPIRIVNAGVSGDTSAGGLSRLPWLLEQHPAVLVVALGGNDGLRGMAPAGTRENLRKIVTAAQAQDVTVLLLGLKMPPNYGPDYTADFERSYSVVADELHVPLLPFMLEGVAGDASLNQGDGIHPTAEGQRIIAEHVLAALRPLLEPLR